MNPTKIVLLISGLIILPWYCFGQVHGSEMPKVSHRWPVPPVRKWIISFNPWGLLEPQAAIGAGIGYRIVDNVEIWSETSFLTRGFSGNDHTRGIRQIFQLKYFFDKNHDFFVAGEVRYKSLSMDNQDNFYDQATHDTLANFSHRSRFYFFGAGLQLGGRFRLGKSNHLSLELTGGLGLKQKTIIRYGVPSGYAYLPISSIDFNARAIMNTPGTAIYLPGSMRIIYSFGRKLR